MSGQRVMLVWSSRRRREESGERNAVGVRSFPAFYPNPGGVGALAGSGSGGPLGRHLGVSPAPRRINAPHPLPTACYRTPVNFQRKRIRLDPFTYRGLGIYFLTICCHNRHPAFTKISVGDWLLKCLVRSGPHPP